MTAAVTTDLRTPAPARAWWQRLPPVALAASIVLALVVLAALTAGWIAPFDPFDASNVDLQDSELPPFWMEGADARFLLGTDSQGRDLLSAILFGMNISLTVAVGSVMLAVGIGLVVGFVCAFLGGWSDLLLMRVADVQMTFPPLLVALILDGMARSVMAPETRSQTALPILIIAIGLSQWVFFARTVRASTRVECQKEYVLAAKAMGAGWSRIVLRHVLPNIWHPLIALATVHLVFAILAESTLSFLGVGVPADTPSLGTLIRTGNEFLLSGLWWLPVLPGLTLVVMALSVNLVGDGLRTVLHGVRE